MTAAGRGMSRLDETAGFGEGLGQEMRLDAGHDTGERERDRFPA